MASNISTAVAYIRSTVLNSKVFLEAPERSASQESNISELFSFGDIIVFCQFWLTIFEFVRAISWSQAFADMTIVVIALCQHFREAFIKKKSQNMGIA